MTAVGMLAAGLGLTLIWCGIRDEDIRTVIGSVFTGQRRPAPATGGGGMGRQQ